MAKEYIERETIFRGLAEICEKYWMCFGKHYGGFAEALHNLSDELPKADVAEVKHGKWIKDRNCYTCSECGFYYFANNSKANYCPNCGARMDEEENL